VSVVKLSPVKDNVVAAEIVETIRGKAPADPKLSLHFAPDGELTADDLNAMLPGTALLVLSAPENRDLSRDPAGALLVGKCCFSSRASNASAPLPPTTKSAPPRRSPSRCATGTGLRGCTSSGGGAGRHRAAAGRTGHARMDGRGRQAGVAEGRRRQAPHAHDIAVIGTTTPTAAVAGRRS
jgi:hypothetical protein